MKNELSEEHIKKNSFEVGNREAPWNLSIRGLDFFNATRVSYRKGIFLAISHRMTQLTKFSNRSMEV